MHLRLRQLGHPQRNLVTRGMTLAETLVTIVIVGVLAAVAAPNILALGNNPLNEGVNRLAGQLRLVRAKAISQTSAYRIRWDMLNSADPKNVQTKFIVERPDPSITTQPKNCNATTWVRDFSFTDEDVTTSKKVGITGLVVNSVSPPYILDPAPATPADNWKLCINSRGLADKNVQWTLQWWQGASGPTKRLEIFPGGAIQVYDN